MSNIKPNSTSKRPIVEAIAAKLVKDNIRRNRNPTTDSYALTGISQSLANASIDAKRIRQLMPHILLIENAIVNTTLTNGVGDTDQVTTLNMSTPLWSAGNALSSQLTEVIKEHTKNDYKISDNLNDILRRSLFEDGSVPVMVIPEAAIDKMIMDGVRGDSAVSLESDSTYFNERELGFLNTGGSRKVEYNAESSSGGTTKTTKVTKSVDEFRNSLKYGFTDAITAFASPIINAKSKQLRETSALSRLMPNLESAGGAGYQAKAQDYFKTVTKREIFKSIPHIKHVSEEGGQPIVMFLPARSVIAITSPQDRRDHKGYIVLIGEDGYPVNEVGDYSVDVYNNTPGNNGKDQASQVIQTAYTAMYGVDGRRGANVEVSKQLDLLYEEVLKNDIDETLERSHIDGTVADLTEVTKVMYARLLRNEFTRMVYVPKHFMTYFAYDYDEMGHGISLSERNKLLSTMYINLMLAKYISDFSNAINQQELTIELDEHDLDYENTIATVREEFFANRTGANRYFSSDPMDSISQLQRAGVTTIVNGGQAPGTKVSVRTVEGMRKTIDDGLLENIRRLNIMGYGAIPELIDSSFGVDYASVQWLNNDMFVRSISAYKNDTNIFLTDHMRKYIQFNHDLCAKLLDVIENNFESISENYYTENNITKAIDRNELKSRLLLEFIMNITIELPKIQRGSDESIVESINKYSDLLDTILDKCFPEASMAPSAIGQLAEHGFEPGEFKERLKAVKMREFCISKGIEPELVGLSPNADSDKDPMAVVMQLMVDEEDKVRSTLMEFWRVSTAIITKSNKAIEKTAEKLSKKYGDESETTLGSGDGVDYSSGGDSSDGDGGDGYVDDFDSDFSADSGFDEPAEPEEPEADIADEPEEPEAPEAPAAEEPKPEDNPPE